MVISWGLIGCCQSSRFPICNISQKLLLGSAPCTPVAIFHRLVFSWGREIAPKWYSQRFTDAMRLGNSIGSSPAQDGRKVSFSCVISFIKTAFLLVSTKVQKPVRCLLERDCFCAFSRAPSAFARVSLVVPVCSRLVDYQIVVVDLHDILVRVER